MEPLPPNMPDLPALGQQIKRLLVANRGEIAIRIFETAREMGITCVAVYSDADRGAKHVRAADLAVHLPGNSSAETYLDVDAVLAAAKRTDADAIHPGYGFLAENPDFAAAVIASGFTWIGPPPEVIAAMALKVPAKEAAAAAGLPLVPGAELPAGLSDRELLERVAAVGYPVMIKASAGGGGRGMRVVTGPGDLPAAVAAASREAQASFGDPTVFVERYLVRARHVEVQVFGDGHGNVLHLFERECSIQRRHQKIIEEAPSPGATDITRERMYRAAVALAERIGYVGAGTVEFLVSGDGDQQEFFFLEMNTRLQVEHRVTEEITGTDLVHWQLLVAQGKEFNVDQADLEITGHAIEVRLYAEDPANDFMPSVGRIEVFTPPTSFGPIVDAGFDAGDVISQHYDPLLAKITVQGGTRESATRAMITALNDTTIAGVVTNRDMLLAILGSFPFFAGDTTTAFITEHPDVLRAPAVDPDSPMPPIEVLCAAVFRHLDTVELAPGWAPGLFPGNFNTDPVPPRWRNVRGTPGFVGLQWGGAGGTKRIWLRFDSIGLQTWDIAVTRHDDPYGGEIEGAQPVTVTFATSGATLGDDQGETPLLVEIDGLTTRLSALVDPVGHVVVRGPERQYRFTVIDPHERAEAEAADVGPVSPVPGTVAAVTVAPGDAVSEGQTLVILEAMKMEHRITAVTDGVVAEVLVTPGQAVEAHQVLVTFSGSERSDG